MTNAKQGVPAEAVQARGVCVVSGQERPRRDLIEIGALRSSIADRIRADFPNIPANALVSKAELRRYRQLYVEESLVQEHGDIDELERRVADSIAKADTIAENVEEEYADKRSFGERAADVVASFGGSWAFILWFSAVMAVWMGINLAMGTQKAFDAYPFILLNLVLSTLAAIQAPIIMMSQKRQEAKDRLRALNDYQVNLKAEIEIRTLHEKLDYLMTAQWQRLAEIQQIQIDALGERKQHR